MGPSKTPSQVFITSVRGANTFKRVYLAQHNLQTIFRSSGGMPSLLNSIWRTQRPPERFGLNVSTHTIRNWLHNAGLNSRRACVWVLLTVQHQWDRLDCTEDHVTWTLYDWVPDTLWNFCDSIFKWYCSKLYSVKMFPHSSPIQTPWLWTRRKYILHHHMQASMSI